MINRYFQSLYHQAERRNNANIIRALKETGPHCKIVDIGCWNGNNTAIWAKAAQASEIYGIEPVQSAAKSAAGKGITTYNMRADQGKWPIKAKSVNCIVSNQTIEHLFDVDHFFLESSRVLVKGGYLITSTNNLSSWHNLFALLLGWAPFDLTNSSVKTTGIGNPIAVHPQEKHPFGPTWIHKCIYTVRWLNDWGRLYGFNTVKCYGAGYYPFPSILGRIDFNHSSFITIVMELQ